LTGNRQSNRLRDERNLPIPNTDIIVRDTHQPRLEEHYHDTLRDDLMYMTYLHESKERAPPRNIRLTYNPDDPYTKYRNNPPVGGSKLGKRRAPVTTADNVVRLERICLHTMQKQAITNRSNLLGTIMALRALSGETEGGGGWHSSKGVQIIRAKKNVGGWVRPGIPVGVQVDLQGPQMYDFLATLAQFVLPRLREFSGIVLPSPSTNLNSPSGVSGVVSIGLSPEAMGFFPQIEVNRDAYPSLYGMHIHFITNSEGVGAQNKARALLSGFQLPFARVNDR